ncbi:hypothetical protein BH09PAT2_BH09PAT2_04160 [soil metagenome]
MEEQSPSSIASRLSPDVLKQLIELQNQLPNHTPLPKTEAFTQVDSQGLGIKIDDFLQRNTADTVIIPNSNYLENTKGLTERISAIVQEHYGDSLPVIHFTNGAAGNNIDELVSTGFVERFIRDGSVGRLHVGAFKDQSSPGTPFKDMSIKEDSLINILDKARDIAKEFHHHGLRTNKNQLGKQRGSKFSLPVAIMFPKPDHLDRGTDNYDHWIVPDAHGQDEIISIVTLDPESSIHTLAGNHIGENNVLKQLIHGLGLYRLNVIQNQFYKTNDEQIKQSVALYGHDLVDAYLISRQDYDTAFDTAHFVPQMQQIVDGRRQKYNIFNQ